MSYANIKCLHIIFTKYLDKPLAHLYMKNEIIKSLNELKEPPTESECIWLSFRARCCRL